MPNQKSRGRKKKLKISEEKQKPKPKEETEKAKPKKRIEKPKKSKWALYRDAEELLKGDALLQGMPCWKRMFYKILPFALVAGSILTIHGTLALIKGRSSRTRQEIEMYDQEAIVNRKSIMSVLEDIASNGYSEEKYGPFPADSLERTSMRRYDDLSRLLGREFNELSTFSEMVPRNSSDFKIYRIGLDSRDVRPAKWDEEVLARHPEMQKHEAIIRNIAEACISKQDEDYKKIAGACSVVIYCEGNYFVYSGFITPQAVLRLLNNPSEDAERLKEEFAREFRNAAISGIGGLKNARIVRDTTYRYFERLNEFLSQRNIQ